MRKYRVAQVGIGHRGRIHANAFLELGDRFELVGLCDIDRKRLRVYAEEKQLPPKLLFYDAEEMLSSTKPDVFCFVTQPDVRLPLVELGVRYGVRGLALEKPLATSLHEGHAIWKLCREHNIKAVVSHQQKYLSSMKLLKRTVQAGEIGEIERIMATCQGGMLAVGTHFMDYIVWVNGGARILWTVGHIHGTTGLEGNHPAPDFFLGYLGFENTVRATLECGYLSPRHKDGNAIWVDNRLTVYATHGYAWADTDGLFGALTRSSGGEPFKEAGPGYDPGKPGQGWSTQSKSTLQTEYLRDFADWLDDDIRVHPCNMDVTYHGFEAVYAVCLSALEHRRVDLPLDISVCGDIAGRMKRELGESMRDQPEA